MLNNSGLLENQINYIKLDQSLKIRPNVEYKINMNSAYHNMYCYEVRKKQYIAGNVTLTTTQDPNYPWSPITKLNVKKV